MTNAYWHGSRYNQLFHQLTDEPCQRRTWSSLDGHQVFQPQFLSCCWAVCVGVGLSQALCNVGNLAGQPEGLHLLQHIARELSVHMNNPLGMTPCIQPPLPGACLQYWPCAHRLHKLSSQGRAAHARGSTPSCATLKQAFPTLVKQFAPDKVSLRHTHKLDPALRSVSSDTRLSLAYSRAGAGPIRADQA